MLSFRQTAARDVPQLSDLWLACFEDTPQAVKLFFERNKSDLHGYAATEDGAVIAAVYLIDCTLNGRQAHYLCGAATLPSHRKRGVMSALIDYALGDAAARGDSFSVLLPANDGLYRFYARLGYQKGCTAHALTLDCACDEDAASGSPDVMRLQQDCQRRSFLLWSREYLAFAEAYYACYGAKALTSGEVFALYEQDGDLAEVFYAVYTRLDALKALLHAQGVRRFRLWGNGDNPLFAGTPPHSYGMIRPLDGTEVPGGVYIGLTLS